MIDILIHYLACVLFTCAFTNGLHLVTQKGMLLEKIGTFFLHYKMQKNELGVFISVYRFPHYIRKPLLQCIYCMPSLWGSLIFWSTTYFYTDVKWEHLLLWILVIVSSSYFNLFAFRAVRKWKDDNGV